MGKLTVELIPKTVFFSNVRTLLKQKYWDLVRKESYAKADYKCEICGDTGKNQGYNHNVECHEIWEYDDKKRLQKLTGLISLCPNCHQVKHFGRTSAIGKQAQAFKHMEKVNNWSHKQCVKHVAEAFEEWNERSKYKWHLDLSYLSDNYKIPAKMLTEAQNKRKKQ
tara:strand:- start:1527 stop:2024 length:498 start_codon:yes stop_codon:yes gene_type:complete